MELPAIFSNLLRRYTSNHALIIGLWNEIEENYSNKKRHYHTLDHLEALLQHLLAIRPQIDNWDTILFSLYYHDIIYNPLKTTNEEKSAEFAENRMQLIGVPQITIENCVRQILATKKHLLNFDNDTNIFIDADLSILGQPWKVYENYFKQIKGLQGLISFISQTSGYQNPYWQFQSKNACKDKSQNVPVPGSRIPAGLCLP